MVLVVLLWGKIHKSTFLVSISVQNIRRNTYKKWDTEIVFSLFFLLDIEIYWTQLHTNHFFQINKTWTYIFFNTDWTYLLTISSHSCAGWAKIWKKCVCVVVLWFFDLNTVHCVEKLPKSRIYILNQNQIVKVQQHNLSLLFHFLAHCASIKLCFCWLLHLRKLHLFPKQEQQFVLLYFHIKKASYESTMRKKLMNSI